MLFNSYDFLQRSTEAELLAFREIATKEKRELSNNLEILTQENHTLRQELNDIVTDNQNTHGKVKDYTEQIAGLEVCNPENFASRSI